MKRIIIKLLLLFLIFITFIIVYIKRKDIYTEYKFLQLEKKVVNALNGKFSKDITEQTIKDYNRLQKSLEELNHYDITNIIEPYIKFVEEGVKIYIAKKSGVEEKYKEKWEYSNRKEKLEKGKDIKMEIYDYSDYVCYDMSDEDVENLNNGTFTEKLIEKLKTCLDYEEKDGTIEWQINDTEDRTIELPYNCYIEYKAYTRVKNDKYKKALSINKENFDLEKLEKRDIYFGLKYETYDGTIENEYVSVSKNKDKYWININATTNRGNNLAEAELKSHTCDRIKKEEGIREHQKWLEELTRRYSYDDPDIP